MFAVLIDVLHTVGPALNVCGLLLAVTTELSTGEDDQGGEEPAVTQESHSELNGKFHICRVLPQTEPNERDQGDSAVGKS